MQRMLPNKVLTCVSALDKSRLEAMIESQFVARDLSSSAIKVLHRLRTADLVVQPEDVPRDLVTMNSTVKLVDPILCEEWELTLVYPEEHDPEEECWSVLSPVGSELFGRRMYEPTRVRRPGSTSASWVVGDIPFQPEARNWMTL